ETDPYDGLITTVFSGSATVSGTDGGTAAIASGDTLRALIRLAHGSQPGTCSQIAFIAALSGIARNQPGTPQTNSQQMQASMTVVAFKSMCRPIKSGTST